MKLKILVAALMMMCMSHAYAEDQGKGPGGRGGHPPKMNLTDEQRECLDGILGKPGEGERPSHEKMDAAMKSCGVSKPAKPGSSSSDSSESSESAE